MNGQGYRRFVAAMAVACFTASPALAQTGKDKEARNFNQKEVRIITDTLEDVSTGGGSERDGGGKKSKAGKGKQGGQGDRPKGQAKRETSPPGLQQQVQKGGTLPPGLEKRSLPSNVSQRLGPPPRGTERYIAGNDVVLVEKATGVVLDIIHDVLKDGS